MKYPLRPLTAGVILIALSGGAALAQQQSSTATAAETEAATQTTEQRYGSFEAAKGAFSGSIAGDYTAEELIGRDVVGPQDEEIATISDLLIGSDNSVEKVVLDVGGFLGIGSKPVAVDLSALQQPEGDGDALQTSLSREQLEALPQFEREDDSWIMM